VIPEKMSFKTLIDKASTQNIVAGFVVVSALIASVIYGKWEFVGLITGAALVYLFPKKEK